MPARTVNLSAPYQTIRGASRITGLAQGHIREGCKRGLIPHIKCGQEYRVNIPLLLKQLEAESAASLRPYTGERE